MTDLKVLADRLVATFPHPYRDDLRAVIAIIRDLAPHHTHEQRSKIMKIYAVQHWTDAEAHSGWVTGFGYFSSSLSDTKEELAHLQVNYPKVDFRIASTEIGEWSEVSE